MSTFGEMANEVLANQFSESKYGILVRKWLNDAQTEIAIRANVPGLIDSESVSVVAGTTAYALPTDFLRPVAVYDATNSRQVRARQIDLRDYAGGIDSSATGAPTLYTVTNSGLVLYPSPDQSYSVTMTYYRRPTEMVDDDDPPEIPAEAHPLMIDYALMHAYRREQDWNARSRLEEEYERDLARFIGQQNKSVSEGPKQVRGMWDSVPGPPEAPVYPSY
jgi:hypothetical protein